MKLLLLFLAIPLFADSVAIDKNGVGYVYEGIGGVSAGASSRYIYDYPATQREQILDYLFKPNYGANLQHLKAEIGADTTAGGSEPSHERTNGTIDCSRGYEWQLMKDAKSRNANIYLDSLRWGTPNWTTSQYSANSRKYIVDYVGCAAANGLTMDYTGVSNEDGGAISGWESFTKSLRSDLTTAGYSTTKIVARDGTGTYRWDVCASVAGDATLQSAIWAMGSHYIGLDSDSGCKALTPTTKIWDSEENQINDSTWCDTWACAQNMLKAVIENYAGAYVTKTEIWALVNANNPIILLLQYGGHAGLMRAEEPWSGYYAVSPTIWAIAHMTQFAAPGWQYVDHIALALGGACVVLKSNIVTSDYSVICHTKGASGSQSLTGTMSNGLSTTATVHVFKSNSSTQFIAQSDITPSLGAWTTTLAADSMYSFTTTTGQHKGTDTGSVSSAFPIPYHDTFESYTAGATGKYFSDINGAFEVADCVNTTGKCAVQKVTSTPIFWPSQSGGLPTSIIGDNVMADYQIRVTDASLYATGALKLFVRCASALPNGDFGAYELHVTSAGAWSITMRDGLAALTGGTGSGTGLTVGVNTKHTFTFKVSGQAVMGVSSATLTASMDGSQFASTTDDGSNGEAYAAGPAGIGTSAWIGAEFAQVEICATSGCPTWPTAQSTRNGLFAGANK